MPTYRAFIF
ncbi:hypothetical protein CGLO_13397 [Colletotrichum gloeosporioides Cg-14]|uniref:Uncharacterized protein n=1 Tax=Colletotrichum gloeosporioides (strain Cg-14) TaxID=1237896 RepID=T0LH05_COLGC|nr:hypothetical protein CGLO_13397 [Colletotrichum gloeosporioides Cg-14]